MLSIAELFSLMWLRQPSWILGILAILGLGSWIGVIIYHSRKFFGSDYFIIKAVLLEMTMLYIGIILFGTLGKNPLINRVDIFVVHSLTAMIGGVITGFLIKKYLFAQPC